MIAASLGLDAFLYVTILFAATGGVVAFNSLRARRLSIGAYLCLCAVVLVCIGYAYYLRDIPEETIHVAQYGILGVLVYRALVHRIGDATIYLVATVIVGTVGIVDEYIQWLVPSRVFDLRDIRTNFIAGALAQVAIAAGLRPAMIGGPPTAGSLRRLCNVIAVMLLVLGLSYVNTPERVAWYAERIPSLSFLLKGNRMMIDYGYYHRDAEIGMFHSRFSQEQLEKHNQERGLEVAQILDEYIGSRRYRAFREQFSVSRDAYVHEAGLRLMRRNRSLKRAESQPGKQAGYFMVALREDQILETYFPAAISHSSQRWSDEFRAVVASGALQDEDYVSGLSPMLVTRFSERQVVQSFTIAIGAFLMLGTFFGRQEPAPA